MPAVRLVSLVGMLSSEAGLMIRSCHPTAADGRQPSSPVLFEPSPTRHSGVLAVGAIDPALDPSLSRWQDFTSGVMHVLGVGTSNLCEIGAMGSEAPSVQCKPEFSIDWEVNAA